MSRDSKLKKALIATWVECDNYGSILQAYCLQEVLKELFSTEKVNRVEKGEIRLLNFRSDRNKQAGNSSRKLQKLHKYTINIVFNKILNKFLLRIFRDKMTERSEKFDEFRNDELNLYPKNPISRFAELKKLDAFDLYVAGGDQIWNPKLLDETYLLPWAPENALKISYAPSVCVNHLSKIELKKYQTLDSFKALSVREYTGAVEQISELIHRNIIEVVDPVILYGREKLLKKCKKADVEDYAAIYLLNGAKKRHNIYADFLKKSNLSAKIIPTTNLKNLLFEMLLSNNIDWGVGPTEFVNLIYNAKIMITDSFHGVIVALLLHKDFIVLPREEGGSEQNNRLVSLLEKVGLEEWFGKMPKSFDEINSVNWNEIDLKIEDMRRKSQEFLIANI